MTTVAQTKSTMPVTPQVQVAKVKVDLSQALAGMTSRFEEKMKSRKKVNILVYGESGVGKTPLLLTTQGKVVMVSLDPGGTMSVRHDIGSKIFPIMLEDEDIRNPHIMKDFNRELAKLVSGGVIDSLAEEGGTLAIDSISSLERAALRSILVENNRQLGTPSQPDYGKAMTLVENVLWEVLNFPCNVVLLAHAQVDKDDLSKTYIGPLLIGKSSKRVANIIDEVWYMGVKLDGTRYLRTSTDGLIICRSRLNIPDPETGKRPLSSEEEPNIKNILTKAGFLKG